MPPSCALVINNPVPTPPTFEPLLLSDFEAQCVARYFPTEVISGPQATTNRVWEALPRAGVVHFSCHGTVDLRIGYSGILLLANREVLTPEHFFGRIELSARMVVLSACRTGSPALWVEYVFNLPAAFLAAGAGAVLGTFWHADEMASLLLLTEFYRLWAGEGQSPIKALGGSQEWLMRARADSLRAVVPRDALESPAAQALVNAPPDEALFAEPWYWAGFFLSGL